MKELRVFIVDDEPPARARLRQLLSEAGHVQVVGEADNAQDARDAIAEARPDVVFLDIEMPQGRGTELAAALPEPRPFIVFATAFDQYAVDAFALAATDYLVKPITRARLAGTLTRVREQLSRQSDLEREMAAASVTQAWLLPRVLPVMPGFDCAASTVPARAVGGDFYVAQPLANGRFALALGDIAGKGVAAGLLASSVQARLETLAHQEHPSATRLIEAVNRALLETIESARFATLVYLEIEITTGDVEVVNAGHPAVIVVHEGGTCDVIVSGGPALGILPGARYQGRRLRLEDGAVLVAYSDGMTETLNHEGEELGEVRLVDEITRNVSRSAREVCQTLQDLAREHRGGAPPTDDVTVLVVKRAKGGSAC